MVLKRLLVLILLAASVACTNSGGGKSGIDGTSDTGGGNGAENRAYEAYIVRVDQLPAYKMFVEPKIQQLLAISPMREAALPIVKRWLLYKTWYVAPVSLSTISKDVIGISFSHDKTEQLALQTKKSIWINSQRFAQMAMQDQATLIMHEMIMSLYYLRFKSWENIFSEKIYPDIKCGPEGMDLMNELFPGSDPKPFDADDYENIRSVTGVLVNDFPFKSPKEIDDFLIANKFDRRFTFGLGMNDNGARQKFIVNNNEKLPAATLNEILESAKMLNQLPDQCRGVRFKNPVACGFKFTQSKRKFGPLYEFPVIEITTTSYNNGNPFEFVNTLNIANNTVTGSSVEWVDQKKKLYYWMFNTDPYPTPLKVGTMFRSMVLITLQDLTVESPAHTLLGIQSIPGVVTGKNPRYDDCVYAKPTAKSILDDVIVAQSSLLTDFDKALLGTRASSMPPSTSCRQF